MIFSIRDLSFEFGSVLLEGWFALAARAGCALLILLAAWLVRRWLSKKGIPALLARKWHFNGTPILLRSFAVPIQRMCTAVGVYLAAASLPWAIPGIAKLLLVCFRLVMTCWSAKACMRHRIWPTCCLLPAARRSAPTKHSALCWTPLTRCW